MENIERSTSTFTSLLSDWTGPETSTDTTTDPPLRQDFLTVDFDEMDLTTRVFNAVTMCNVSGLEYLPIGPSSPLSYLINPLLVFRNSIPFIQALQNYAGFVYDSISVTVSMSAPKGFAGGIFVGWFPQTEWFKINNLVEYANCFQPSSEQQMLINSSRDSELLPLDTAADREYIIPWTFQTSYVSRRYIYSMMTPTSSNAALLFGHPLFWVKKLAVVSVSEVTNPVPLRIFMRFNGLKFILPSLVDEPTTRQSGLEVPVGAAIAAVGAEIVDTALIAAASSVGLGSPEQEGTYNSPSAVQMSYLGDTTSTGPPPTGPIFSDFNNREGQLHPVIDYLTQPQYAYEIRTHDSNVSYFDPDPVFAAGDKGCNYLRYFASMNQYWRGTIIFDFVILGHPTVEVAYDLQIQYPHSFGGLFADMASVPRKMGVCTGTYTISVPMPFACLCDQRPIIDALVGRPDGDWTFSSRLATKFSVINSMTDVTPEFSIAVFVRAGDDFLFFQPYAPGYNFVISSGLDKSASPTRAKDLKMKTTRQVGIPATSTTFETRAVALGNECNMPSLANLEDYLSMWCRAIPFSTADGHDEPIPDLEVGLTSPSWNHVDFYASIAEAGVNQNSVYQSVDYIYMISRLFCFYHGSIAAKIVVDPRAESALDSHHFRYVEIVPQRAGRRQHTHTPYSFTTTQFPNVNLGNGAVVTPSGLQPVLDVTVPYRSNYNWNPTVNYIRGWQNPNMVSDLYDQPDTAKIVHNIILQEPGGDLRDALFRKAGPDFSLAVPTLLPPPGLWLARGYDW